MKKLASFIALLLLCTFAQGQFAPNTVLTAAQLNYALAHPAIVAGSIDGTPIGASIPATGKFTTLQSSTPLSAGSGGTGTSYFSVAGPTALRTYTFPDANATIARRDAAQTFSGTQTFSGDTQLSTMTATGQVSLGGAAGAEGLRVGTTASAVNYAQIQGAVTGASPYFGVAGSDANIGMRLLSRGTGLFSFETGGGRQLSVINTANAVNYPQLTGSATGGPTILSNAGTDTNIGMYFATKGSGAYQFTTGTGAYQQFGIVNTSNAVNYFQASGGATGNSPYIAPVGSDADIIAQIYSKGAGSINLTTASTGSIRLLTNNGTEQFRVTHTANAVNFPQLTGGATGNSPTLSVSGSDTNIGLNLQSKGNASVYLKTNNGSQISFVASPSGLSDVNYLNAISSGTGNAVKLSAQGSDTDRSIEIQPAGAGTVNIDGGLKYVSLHASNTAPTISGFGTSPSVTANNGTSAFSINVGSGGTASTGTITFPTAANHWVCQFVEASNAPTLVTAQTGGTSTTVAVTNYSRTTGLATAWSANDILYAMCSAF